MRVRISSFRIPTILADIVVHGRTHDESGPGLVMASSMRIVVLGSGGIGGYYGALLAKAGHEVSFIARGAHLEAMQTRGVTVRTPEGVSTIPVTAVADTKTIGTTDLVLFCVKSYDTEPAAQALAPLMARDTTVITLQNGVDNVEAIATVVGSKAVLAGSVYVALQLVSPGVILRTGGEGRVVFGEVGGAVTERVQRIAGAFQQSGVPHQVSTDINRVLWEKFLFIAGIGGVTALARSGIGPLLASAEGRTLLTTSCAEIAAVALAERVPLFQQPPSIAFSSRPRRCPRNGDRRWPGTSKTAVVSRWRR
jgi:2-dehydropantoate 2-reductase